MLRAFIPREVITFVLFHLLILQAKKELELKNSSTCSMSASSGASVNVYFSGGILLATARTVEKASSDGEKHTEV